MKIITLFALAGLCIAPVAGCSLSPPTRQTTPAAASQSNNGSFAQTSVTPVNTAAQTGAHPNEGPNQSSETNDELHTPEKGSAERQAIMDALRGDQQVVFQVNYLKVHVRWCWVDTTPLDRQGHATAEGGPNLLHMENGKWKVMDLSKVPEDPNDPLGPEDASPTFVKNVMKTFPGVPRDIFPKPTK